MTLPGLREWSFSIKTFAAAMLALWIALRIGLDRPYWAMATAYIVAQPLTGAMRSKALYRFAGTILGAVASLALVPNLVNAPVLLAAALALWTGLCIYFGVLDRTPRSYLFLLAGYSAALISFPSVDAPDAIWDVVLARVEEITLGIVCATLIGSLVFPVALGPALLLRIDHWIRDTATWGVAALAGRPEDPRAVGPRHRVAADAIEIGQLASHLAFDTSNLQQATLPVMLLQQRIMLLLPALSGVAERIAALRQDGGVPEALESLLHRLARWVAAGRSADIAEADRLRAAITALEPPVEAAMGWNAIMQSALLVRLGEVVDLAHDVMALRRQIASGERHLPPLAIPRAATEGWRQHHDHLMALHSAAAAMLAIGLVCAFWIATAWPDGAGAAALAAVACSFFAAQDDPAVNITGFLRAAVIAILIDAAYLFAILPVVHDFGMLVLALAPTYLLLGVLVAMPATARAAGPIAFIAATELALSSSYSGDFAAYTNGSLAAIAGLAAAAVVTRIVRSVGADWTARRLLRANRLAIARAAEMHRPMGRLVFAGRLLDRLSLIVPRLASAARGANDAAFATLTDLRVGINVVDMQRDVAGLGPDTSAALHAVLDAVADHYRHHAPGPPPPSLLEAIDRAIPAVTASPGATVRPLLKQLVGMRLILFPAAPPYLAA
jgi:uncharacterized membrane protein YccC